MNDSIRVLLIEDNPGDTRLIRELLSEEKGGSFRLECADRLSAGMECLASGKVDVVLLDLGLPDSQGFDTFIKAHNSAPQIPIVILSCLADEELAARAVREGAQDYLLKGHVDSNLLGRSLRYAIERKQVEEKLKQAAEEWKTTFDSIPDFIVIIDKDFRIVRLNKACADLLKAKPQELIGRRCYELFHNSDAPPQHCPYLKVLEKRAPATVEYFEPHLGINLELSASLIFDSKREIVGMLEVIKDVTERKQVELSKELRWIAEDNFRNSLDSSPLGIRIVSAEGELLYANQSILDIYGYSSVDELEAVPRQQRYTPESYIEHRKRIENRKLGKPVLPDYEISIVRKDGEVRHLSVFRKEVFWSGKTQFQMLYQDITERWQAEEELNKFKTISDEASYGAVIISLDNIFIYVNEALARMHGYTTGELLGQHLSILHTEEQMELVERLRSQLIEVGSFVGEELWHKRKDGTVFPALVTGTAMKRVTGEVSYLTATVLDITEHKRAEEALRESEQRYRELAESISDPFFAMNGELRFTYWNKASEELTGISAEDALGKYAYDLFPDMEATRKVEIKEIYLKAIRTKQPQQFVNEYQLGGKDFVFEINAYPSQYGISVFSKDITEHKRAERELELRAQLLDAVSDSIALNDFEGRFVYINEAAYKSHGYTKDELMGMDIRDLVAPEYVKSAESWMRKVQNREITVQTVHLRKDKSTMPVEVHSKVVEWGGVKFYLSVARDITESKQAEETLREREENFRSLAENAFDGILVGAGMAGQHVYANQRAAEIIGYSTAELVNTSIKDLVPPGELKTLMERYKARLEGKHVPNTYETVIVRKDGKSVPIELAGMLTVWHGRPADLVTFRDITERKLAEEILKRSEQNYRELAESISDVFFALNKELRYTYWNKASEELTGVSAKDALGKHLYDIFPDVGATRRAGEIYQKTIRTKQPQQFVNEYQLGGKEFVFEISAYPSQDSVSVFAKDITERKRVEEKYRQLLEDINDGYVVLQEGKCVFANGRFGEIFGYEPEQTIGKSLDQLIVPDNRQVLVEWDERVMRGEEAPAEQFEATAMREDRTAIIVEASIKVIQYEDKPALSVIVREITERKRAEKELELRAQLLDAVSDSIALHDFEGKFIYVNEATYKSHGYTKDELMGMNIRDLVAPEYVKFAESWMRKVQKREITVQTVHLRKDKSTIPIEVHSKVIEQGGAKLCLSVARDITERKMAEERIKIFSSAVAGAIDGIAITDMKGTITYANLSMEELLGYNNGEMLGKSVVDLARNKKMAKGIISTLIKTGSWSGEIESIKKNKETFPAILSLSIVRDEKGNPIALMGTVRDITERRKMEEQLIVTDRLASIGELASGMAHELNNPLTSVIGFSELLLEKDVPDDVKEDLRTINKEAQRTADVVRNLLIFARKHPKEKQLVDINNMIQKVLELRAYEQRINNIKVNTQLAPGLPEIMADGFQLQQVFMNIIINAEYFMIEAHGRGILTITTERVGDIIQTSLADDGPGIAEENLGHIFDPFFTTKEVGKGTGLGLSICHGVVTAHSGRIYAESESGKGATFVVELPISQQ